MQNKKIPTLFWEVILILVCALIYGYGIACLFSLSFSQFSSRLLKSFYIPHWNQCFLGDFDGISIYSFVYLFIPLAWFFLIGFRIIRKKRQTEVSAISPIIVVVFTTFFFVLNLQLINQAQIFSQEIEFCAPRTIPETYRDYFASKYIFPRFCRSLLPGERHAQFITDDDLNNDDHLFIQIVMSYFLYPLKTRPNYRQQEYIAGFSEPVDTLIIYRKSEPFAAVPENFKVIGIYNETNLLAVKKGVN